MSLREFEREVRVRSERMKQEEEAAWMRSATETAYMMNMVGGAVAGKTWKSVQPNQLFDIWTGKSEPADAIEERIKEADRVHDEIVKRESWGYIE